MVKKGETATGHRTALYRKYRPRSLDDIVSQNHATEILRRSLAAGKVSHAYLLTGPKGVGKTSIARILAHEINQLPYTSEGSHLDIIEIDAASNNGVDDVRELRDRVALAPISASKKIYIIDEVHMLSKQAFNALLKTLEEPPEHVVFILATTDLHKVPGTIISRTQHFAFHAISREDLAAHLKKIAKGEGIKITDEALDMIAARGDGSFRNAIGLLDQLSGYSDGNGITRELVESTLGFAPAESVELLLNSVRVGDINAIVATLGQMEHQGIQPAVLADQLIGSLHDSLGEQPQLVDLLDALLAVPSSAQPRLKLLTTLVMAAKPKANPTMAAVATKPKPVPKVLEAPVIVVDKSELEKSVPAAAPAAVKPVKKQPFAWDNLLAHTQKNHVALYSVLVKCGHDYADGTLTLYAGKKFNKTKLDEPKYHGQLQEALITIGCPDTNVITLAETKPPADKKLAEVAALMGGGEEVDLDETGPKS